MRQLCELDEFLKNNSQIERYTHVQFTKMSVPRNKSNISVYVYVPENLETFNKDVTLQDRKTKEKYKLTEAGTVISEKTATLTGLKVGDTMTITKDGKNYETKIAAVTENYMGHYIYMTGNVYEQTFGEKPNYSATVFTVKEEVSGCVKHQLYQQSGGSASQNAWSIGYGNHSADHFCGNACFRGSV